MSYIFRFLTKSVMFFPKLVRFMPMGFAGIFVVAQFFSDLFSVGVSFAFAHVAQTIFGAELTINKMVSLAVENSSEYTIWSFISIIISVYIMFMIVKWVGKFVRLSVGGNQSFGEYFVGLFILVVLSIASAKIVDGVWGFVPLRDSLWYLVRNLTSVFNNIHYVI